MKKFLKYFQWIPFAICLGALIIYLVYTIEIKLNPVIVVTDKLISTLKTYLIIALIALFIGLLIILIKKIYYLNIPSVSKEKVKKEKKKKEKVAKEIKQDPPLKISQEKVEEVYTINDKKEYTFKLDGVTCPECSGLISKDAAICPHCGILFDDELLKFIEKHKNKIKNVQKIEYTKKTNKKGVLIANICLIILFIILTFLIINLLINKANENKSNILPSGIIEIQK